jgi:hypothetical protein
MCSLIGVFPCVFSFHTRYVTAFFRSELSYLRILIRLSYHTQPPPVGYLGVRHFSMSILYSLHPSLPSFETSKKNPDFFSFIKRPKKIPFLPFTSLPAPSPFTTLPSLPDSADRSHGFTLHISVRLPVMSCPTSSPIRMSFVPRLSFRTDDERSRYTVTMDNNYVPMVLVNSFIKLSWVRQFVEYTGESLRKGTLTKVTTARGSAQIFPTCARR